MQIVRPDKIGIKKAVEILKRGGIIVYPTDTAYGLGGIYGSQKVINKILKIKNRSNDKFTLITSSLNQAVKFFKLNSSQIALVKKYWPGPLSIVVSSKYSIRVPKNKISQSLSRRVGKPLIATSANFSGQTTIYNVKKIINQFDNKKNQPDLIIDAGNLPKVLPSTIVKVNQEGIEIIRQGTIKIVDY